MSELIDAASLETLHSCKEIRFTTTPTAPSSHQMKEWHHCERLSCFLPPLSLRNVVSSRFANKLTQTSLKLSWKLEPTENILPQKSFAITSSTPRILQKSCLKQNQRKNIHLSTMCCELLANLIARSPLSIALFSKSNNDFCFTRDCVALSRTQINNQREKCRLIISQIRFRIHSDGVRDCAFKKSIKIINQFWKTWEKIMLRFTNYFTERDLCRSNSLITYRPSNPELPEISLMFPASCNLSPSHERCANEAENCSKRISSNNGATAPHAYCARQKKFANWN